MIVTNYIRKPAANSCYAFEFKNKVIEAKVTGTDEQVTIKHSGKLLNVWTPDWVQSPKVLTIKTEI